MTDGRVQANGRQGVEAAGLARIAAGAFLLGAGAIHLIQVPSHFEDDAVYGWFFLLVGCGQLAGGLAVLKPRSPEIYLALASLSLSTIGIWVITRTLGVPIGLRAGVVEPAGAPDLAASALEALTAAVLFALGGPLRDRRFWFSRVTGKAPAAFLLILTASTGALVVLSERENRTICHHHNPSFGPLAAVSGHSILPEGRPPVPLRMGRPHLALAGFLVNCSNSSLRVTHAGPLSFAGESVEIKNISMLPARHRPLEVACGQPARGKQQAIVPPSTRRPEVALYMLVNPVGPGATYLNAVEVAFRYRGVAGSQPLATAVSLDVRAGSGNDAAGC